MKSSIIAACLALVVVSAAAELDDGIDSVASTELVSPPQCAEVEAGQLPDTDAPECERVWVARVIQETIGLEP